LQILSTAKWAARENGSVCDKKIKLEGSHIRSSSVEMSATYKPDIPNSCQFAGQFTSCSSGPCSFFENRFFFKFGFENLAAVDRHKCN